MGNFSNGIVSFSPTWHQPFYVILVLLILQKGRSRNYSKSIEENLLRKIPQGKIKFQTERVRDRQRQRKNDREIESWNWDRELKLVQKYDENLHKCGIVVRLISTFLSTRKCTCRQREKWMRNIFWNFHRHIQFQ